MADENDLRPPEGATGDAVHWWWRGKMESEVNTLKGAVGAIGDKVDTLRTDTIPDIKNKISKLVIYGGITLFFGNILAAIVVAVVVKAITKGW